MHKKMIMANFSKSAGTYDDHARVQKICASLLLEICPRDGISRVLEIGCGTGIYTELLAEKYPTAKIVSVDISEEMVNAARAKGLGANVDIFSADAECLDMGMGYDLVTSNASLQWINGLDGFFSSVAGALSPGGSLCFSIYGPETFWEMQSVLEEVFGERALIEAARFKCLTDIERSMSGLFSRVEIVEQRCGVDFPDMVSFMRDVRLSGTRGEGLLKKVFFGREKLKAIEDAYIKKCGRIIATHQVFLVTGRKRG
ncbi:MAG: methyltransferase domain-containing protein [Candidatus Omnitrophica bacterium]|nr:methyltransferase domain-containing protein [Candidatus Omnitrophota bacterium]MDD4013526.1 methyltransferase domain-containing protein [Candidatus Omnitrophota bacterium]